MFEIRIAPLRERTDDILPLTELFLQKIGELSGRQPAVLASDAREALLGYDWPGNVRELRNALERATIVCEDGLIRSADLELLGTRRASTAPTTDLSTIERDMVARVLGDVSWNKSAAARRLGLSRMQLYGRIQKFGLEK